MGYGGKVAAQQRARELRAQGWTYGEIVEELGVSKSSVSLWCRDVAVDPALLDGRRRARYLAGNLSVTKRPSSLQLRKEAEIEACRRHAAAWLGELNDRDLFVAGIALYAGEGTKRDGAVKFTNTDPRMMALFMRWFRRFFLVDERRLRVRVYLHEGLDLDAATRFWSSLLAIPPSQFGAPYRAKADPSMRRSKHVLGCASVSYSCSASHRLVMGLIEKLLSEPESICNPG